VESIESVKVTLDQLRKVGPKGHEYWEAREIQLPLGYARWEDFEAVIQKARMTCESMGTEPRNHFHLVVKLVPIGSGAQRKIDDYLVSRYGAYLIAMNGNSKIPQIAAAQNYFAVQTRKQELTEQFGIDIAKRAELRVRVKDANKHLVEAAKYAGVQRYDLFHAAGYHGLYTMPLKQIKEKKGIDPKEDLLDRAGRAELAANEFRITQAEEKLKREKIQGQDRALAAHKKVGEAVRKTISELGGTMPEDLPAEPSLKKLERQGKNRKTLPEKKKTKTNKKPLK
jgi:DNA-damage-inducible protein D